MHCARVAFIPIKNQIFFELNNLVPIGHMAHEDEGGNTANVLPVSSYSSYVAGANLIMDGGRPCWWQAALGTLES